ncbi:MAG: hypothetical protein ACYDC1_10315 [Limisphaerales bacterium]
MRFLMVFLIWCVLLMLSWPVAVAALLLFPFAWLIALPFRILFGIGDGFLALLRAFWHLPARLLGGRR